ncbi:UNVERIFIED_CONTAM: hypothetical protein H355_015276 [Colinus virginianus]|nr:hypothetical protein H355_015276 [Colinus virginianus]
MGRMYGPGKGMSASALPWRRRPPTWLKMKASDVEEHITKLAKKGQTPSQVRKNRIKRVAGEYKGRDEAPSRPRSGDGNSSKVLMLEIGVTLRDSFGVPQVKSVTTNKILRILKLQGLAPELPEDLYYLIKKAVSVRKHLERNRKDKDAKFRLILVESRIHRLARYYKRTKQLPASWKYQASTASAMVA